jgi:hypothetical protein
MDQNTVTIISNIVVLVAALGGAAIGALLTNRYSLGQEKRRLNIERVEELYELVEKVHDEVDEFLAAGVYLEAPKDIPLSFRRMRVIVDLYFLSLVPKVVKFSETVTNVMNAKSTAYKNEQGVAVKIRTPELEEADKEYYQDYRRLQEALYHIKHHDIS